MFWHFNGFSIFLSISSQAHVFPFKFYFSSTLFQLFIVKFNNFLDLQFTLFSLFSLFTMTLFTKIIGTMNVKPEEIQISRERVK